MLYIYFAVFVLNGVFLFTFMVELPDYYPLTRLKVEKGE